MRLAFLASHNGSSMKVIVEAIDKKIINAESALIISNNSHSPALEFAQQQHIPWKHLSRRTEGSEACLDDTLLKSMQAHDIDLIIMSGWMVLVGPKTVTAYKNKILNSHPALFSSQHKGHTFYGDTVYQAVFEAGDTETGVTIHIADEQFDNGKVLGEVRVPVLPEDSLESLKQRVQKEERILYIAVIKDICNGKITL